MCIRGDRAIAACRGSRGGRGYTVLEVCVAMVVAGLLMASLLPAGQGALSRLHGASRLQEATAVAANALAMLGPMGALESAASLPLAGTEAGFQWRVSVQGEARGVVQGARLLFLRVSVSDERGGAPLVDFEVRRMVFSP